MIDSAYIFPLLFKNSPSFPASREQGRPTHPFPKYWSMYMSMCDKKKKNEQKQLCPFEWNDT